MTVGALLKNKDRTVISVEPSTPVLEIAEIISSRRIGAVLVLDPEGDVLGIVSERDVVKALAAHAGKVVDMRADELMTRKVTTATFATTVDEAMEIMDAGYFRHLPVVAGEELIGIVSVRDVVRARLQEQAMEVDSLKEFVHRGAHSAGLR
jgi:CBS domain-containing protein